MVWEVSVKTTLATAYVFQYYDDYQHIAWITQNSDDIADDFVQSVGLIQNLEVDMEGKDQMRSFWKCWLVSSK